LQPSGSHEPLEVSARHRLVVDTAVTHELGVHLAHAVEATPELGIGVHSHDLGLHPLIALSTR